MDNVPWFEWLLGSAIESCFMHALRSWKAVNWDSMWPGGNCPVCCLGLDLQMGFSFEDDLPWVLIQLCRGPTHCGPTGRAQRRQTILTPTTCYLGCCFVRVSVHDLKFRLPKYTWYIINTYKLPRMVMGKILPEQGENYSWWRGPPKKIIKRREREHIYTGFRFLKRNEIFKGRWRQKGIRNWWHAVIIRNPAPKLSEDCEGRSLHAVRRGAMRVTSPAVKRFKQLNDAIEAGWVIGMLRLGC